MKSDYQLKHQIYGRQGSVWERQVDAPTRRQIRGLIKSAGQHELLTYTDQLASAAIGARTVLVEDAYFRFIDGDFAVVGRHQRNYSHAEAELDDGTRLHIAYRPTSAVTSTTQLPTVIARITADFAATLAASPISQPVDDRDWYLVPIPIDLIPIVIQSKHVGVFLVAGIDFLLRDGYIVMTDNPAGVLPAGLVKVPAARRRIAPLNSFVISSPIDRFGGKSLVNYVYKSQAIDAFRAAAAEYAGLYVFQTADVILGVADVGDDAWVYTTVAAGAVEIRYPHAALAIGQQVSPGFVVCNQLDVVMSKINDPVNYKETAAAAWTGVLLLDALLPVNGLTWTPNTPVVVDTVATDPTSLKPHVRLHFDGDPGVQQRYWEFSRLHEQQTQVFLSDDPVTPPLPGVIDFWDIMETYYGRRLILILAEVVTTAAADRLMRFIRDQHPASCIPIIGINVAGVPYLG